MSKSRLHLEDRFVILAAPRSGSNMLCTMLGSHSSILCHHEVFNPKGIRVALPLRDTDFSLGTVEERRAAPEAFLERIWTRNLGFPSVGFKFTYRQDEAIYRRLLADDTIAKIVLRRQNRMKAYVSHRISETLDEWEVYSERNLMHDRPRVSVDPGRFLERVAFDEAYYREIQQAVTSGGHSWIEVRYERLSSLAEQNAILGFLGVEPTSEGLKPRSIKQNSSHLRDLVVNFEELVRYFAGTEFEAELHAVSN